MKPMLEAHFDAVEATLLQTSKISANAGHTLHRGTPRENLIANFLSTHLSSNVSIGTGEIIDHRSAPREQRNQYDIIIYRNNYPKLDFGGVSGFLVESVLATIEVKSLLDEAAMHQAVSAAANLKRLEPQYSRHVSLGWFPPKPLSFVIAYAGPAQMDTVKNWQKKACAALDLPRDEWVHTDRLKTPGHSLDGVAVLGRGAHFLCNTPLFPSSLDPRARTFLWEGERGALMFFFLALQDACMAHETANMNTKPYLTSHAFNGTFYD
ncbi:DUF6602 domain-containing protein [Burkholderia sp. SIMBA_062]|uniref:DUF6602 domain-containing protein n=1 Tax=Burkholderia sp. SIMBA_062 TaxID=3085803 RepID=UPI00397942CD